jgi:hypothetical protein
MQPQGDYLGIDKCPRHTRIPSQRVRFSQFALSIVVALAAFAGAMLGSYFGPYTQASITRRNDLANAMESYYAASASEFYAQQTLDKADEDKTVSKSGAYYLELMKEENHYNDWLAASTRLSLEVRTNLREKILSIEDEWDRINDHLDASAEKTGFKDLDDIRQTVLDFSYLRISMTQVSRS